MPKPENETAAPVAAGHGGSIRESSQHAQDTMSRSRLATTSTRYLAGYTLSADLLVIAFAVADRGLS